MGIIQVIKCLVCGVNLNHTIPDDIAEKGGDFTCQCRQCGHKFKYHWDPVTKKLTPVHVILPGGL